jgi:hypothetical protein
MGTFFASISEFFNSTQIPEQIHNVDPGGLFGNPWFLVPFLGVVGYFIYKKNINNLILTALIIGLWLFTGSSLVEGLFKGDTLQTGKILPIVGVGAAAVGVVVYVFFMRSD